MDFKIFKKDNLFFFESNVGNFSFSVDFVNRPLLRTIVERLRTTDVQQSFDGSYILFENMNPVCVLGVLESDYRKKSLYIYDALKTLQFKDLRNFIIHLNDNGKMTFHQFANMLEFILYAESSDVA